MTSEIEKTKKKFPRNYFVLKLVLLIIFAIFLFYFYNTLISLGSSHLLALLILLFSLLLFIGLLFKGKEAFSLFKRNRNNNLQQNEKEKYLKQFEIRHVRRIDNIKLDSKYKKPIIRKCPNCRMLLPHFVKKCPNCGEVITS